MFSYTLRVVAWTVLVHPDAVSELAALGPSLGYPHSSAIQGADRLRELRPRAGRSAWRVFYRQTGDVLFVVAAISPEAQNNPRAFNRAVALAEERLAKMEEDT
jgi:hypothetical protein